MVTIIPSRNVVLLVKKLKANRVTNIRISKPHT